MTLTEVQSKIVAEAYRWGVDPALALAVAKQESGFAQSARGTSGEVGIFQLMPGTAAGLGVNPYDLDANITGGVRYLSQQLEQFDYDPATALAAYNAGPGNVRRGIIPASTRQYQSAVLAYRDQFAAGLGVSVDPGASQDPLEYAQEDPGGAGGAEGDQDPGLWPGGPSTGSVVAGVLVVAAVLALT